MPKTAEKVTPSALLRAYLRDGLHAEEAVAKYLDEESWDAPAFRAFIASVLTREVGRWEAIRANENTKAAAKAAVRAHTHTPPRTVKSRGKIKHQYNPLGYEDNEPRLAEAEYRLGGTRYKLSEITRDVLRLKIAELKHTLGGTMDLLLPALAIKRLLDKEDAERMSDVKDAEAKVAEILATEDTSLRAEAVVPGV